MNIVQADFSCVGNVAKHCDNAKLCVAIDESKIFDVAPLFCDFWQDIVDIDSEIETYREALKIYEECLEDEWEECIEPIKPDDYDVKVNLIYGGSFEVCNNKVREHFGVKRIWVYYAYSRYLLINEFNDTPNGQVAKTNNFSIPKDAKEIRNFAEKYRNMGYDSYKMTLNFLCANRDVFEWFTSNACGSCKCGGDCNSQTKAKGFGFRGKIITKRI